MKWTERIWTFNYIKKFSMDIYKESDFLEMKCICWLILKERKFGGLLKNHKRDIE